MLLSDFLKSKKKINRYKNALAKYNKENGFKPSHHSQITDKLIDTELMTICRSFLLEELDHPDEWIKLDLEHKATLDAD